MNPNWPATTERTIECSALSGSGRSNWGNRCCPTALCKNRQGLCFIRGACAHHVKDVLQAVKQSAQEVEAHEMLLLETLPVNKLEVNSEDSCAALVPHFESSLSRDTVDKTVLTSICQQS
mmetsp:Transcript_3945/g.9089  ORF Transcript_3945/g.9089 Transcript_3945/m.9089 type:complete len:120 (-) Transcript_3945:1694-2053(-)